MLKQHPIYFFFITELIKLKSLKSRKRHGIDKLSETKPPKSVIHNFSSFDLAEDEIQASSQGLNQHIPSSPDRYKTNTNFEYFYQNVLNDISDLLQHHLDNIKTKLRSTRMKYHNSKTTNKYKNVIDRLSKNNLCIFYIMFYKKRM